MFSRAGEEGARRGIPLVRKPSEGRARTRFWIGLLRNSGRVIVISLVVVDRIFFLSLGGPRKKRGRGGRVLHQLMPREKREMDLRTGRRDDKFRGRNFCPSSLWFVAN